MDYLVNHITYKYGEEAPLALDDIHFSIQKGKVTAIVGPSGCGKSTLVEILSGVIPKLIGNGVLSGSFDIPDDALVSVVSQNPENQLFGYGVEDAIAFGLENIGMPQEQISERIEYVLDLLNLQYLRKRSVSNLSGGQRQAVCIASVLAMNPDILIMDEPVSSLDPNGKALVRSILVQLSADSNTVVVVDNNLSWSAGIVDHVIGLLDGKVVFDGDRDTFFRDFDLQKKLGVIIPQEVEIYRALARKHPDLPMFYTMEEGERCISKLLNGKRGSNSEPLVGQESETVISVHSLSQTFSDGFHALIDVNANLPEGKVIAILGQNGSGKTTFLKHLNGLLKPTVGDIRYRGVSIVKKTVAQISKNIILVFQHPEHMLFESTVEQEITFVARMQGVAYKPEEIDAILNQYGMEGDKETFPLNLSMGKKHMLTILSVLLSSADVIMLDEPTLGMDGFLIEQLEQLIASLKASGKTVIMISHEMPLVFRTVDNAVVLNQGKKVFEGSKEELARQDALFESINISLPPVVMFSKRFGLKKICFNVEDFCEEIEQRISSPEQV